MAGLFVGRRWAEGQRQSGAPDQVGDRRQHTEQQATRRNVCKPGPESPDAFENKHAAQGENAGFPRHRGESAKKRIEPELLSVIMIDSGDQ